MRGKKKKNKKKRKKKGGEGGGGGVNSYKCLLNTYRTKQLKL